MNNKNEKLHCSFCGRNKDSVSYLIGADDGSCICDGCVDVCVGILKEQKEGTKINFTKVKCVKSPRRGTKGSVGFDFFVPNFDEPRHIFPGEKAVIPSGIHVRIPCGFMLKAEDKSGVGVNKMFKYIGGVVDSDYTGEVHIILANIGNEVQTINPGEKVIQFILIPVCMEEICEVSSLEELYFNFKTERKEGKFGSTGIF